MSHPRSHPNTAKTSRKAISLTNSEQLNAKSVKVNTHPKVNAPKLWAITLSFHLIAIRHCFLIHPFRNPYSYTFGSMCFARFFIAARRFARSAVYVASGLSVFIFTLPFASVVVPWK